MITTQRVIIYRIDNDSDGSNFEILNSYDFSTSMTVVPIENDDGHAYIQFLKPSSRPSKIHCDTLEQASNLSRDIQRAQTIFEENKMIYIPSDDENEDNFDE